ncbi:MAG: sialate O-acetylesterase [Opitutales bacterium]
MLSKKSKSFVTAVFFSLASLSALAAANHGPLKVFILSGQSNMQGHAHLSTLEVIGLDPETMPMLEKMIDARGEPRVIERVWISSIGSSASEAEEKFGPLTTGYGAERRGPKVGPEFTFGIYMAEQVQGPILLIKTAWGGKSLHTDFRPPSAGPYTFDQTTLEKMKADGKDVEALKKERAEASGHYYRLMMEHIRKVLADIERVYPEYDARKGYELAGFVWFQGWNDMTDGGVYPNRNQPGGYDAYTELLGAFIKDVRKDLSTPELPFVIGVMGVNGPTALYKQDRYKAVHQNFRDAMAAPAALPEFKDNVAAVLTEKYWDMELSELRDREKQIMPQIKAVREKVKQKELSQSEGQQAEAILYNELFTERELTILKKGASNFEFHYLGSAKILGQIGKAFAEAMGELLKK